MVEEEEREVESVEDDRARETRGRKQRNRAGWGREREGGNAGEEGERKGKMRVRDNAEMESTLAELAGM